MVTTVRRLAEQEHSTALAQLASSISAMMKFGAGAGDDPFVKVFITNLINRLQAEASSQTNQKSYFDEEMSKATEKEDLEADVAKHSSKLEAAVARPIVLDGEISALQSELGVLSNRQLHMDIMCAVERYILAKVKADFEQGISGVQKALESLRHHSMNSIDRVQKRLVEQTTETPVIPFVDKIVEMLVDQTRGKALQTSNTHAQHVASTVEVETPKIIKEAVRGKKFVIWKKISQVVEHIKNPKFLYTNKVLDLMKDVPVVMQQQMLVQKTAET